MGERFSHVGCLRRIGSNFIVAASSKGNYTTETESSDRLKETSESSLDRRKFFKLFVNSLNRVRDRDVGIFLYRDIYYKDVDRFSSYRFPYTI